LLLICCRPQNYKELFNLRHAKLRNIIERQYGTIKARFPILTNAPQFPEVGMSVAVTYACFALSNFIRCYDGELDFQLVAEDAANAFANGAAQDVPAATQREGERKRDAIAMRMWNDYVAQQGQ
jgi:hypothetical protein